MRRPDDCVVGRARREARRAFTLVELMIVIVMLAILATLVVPQMTNASASAKQASLKDDLRYMRTQVLLYKAQHGETPPGYPGGNRAGTPDEATFVSHMTQFTDAASGASATRSGTHKFGPYVLKMPKNPLNGLSSVLVLANNASRPAASNTYGWVYKPHTQEFWSDATGVDDTGKPYADY